MIYERDVVASKGEVQEYLCKDAFQGALMW